MQSKYFTLHEQKKVIKRIDALGGNVRFDKSNKRQKYNLETFLFEQHGNPFPTNESELK
jgi:hypothetical protein